ncbi:hypothetical protein [Ureibacillus aquaedulcis]|uniref:Uncharacterized protein n=1 Tax=Ureibacillus aquaedulcis TaxID=3058421 RepID=A0ABT8GL54_9BACL|nr:hypothetical protein [Ureibacillus sp. BA0131]MDN4492148.1 hypothetical protein [Ureibacillus sp. BA0131]
MKIIQCISDIEYLKSENKLPKPLINEIEQDLLAIYEAEPDDVYLLNFRLPLVQALFIFEAGDNVLAILNDPFTREYVEEITVDDVKYYRCGLRKGLSMQLYYSLKNIHNEETEEWLSEQVVWNEGISDL